MLIDTHCHISKESYDNVDDVIKKMNGNILITSMASPSDLDEVLRLTKDYKNVYGTLGIHPECANSYCDDDLKKIEKYLSNPKIVGIGEIGLDYYYGEDREKQKELFIKQINLANKYSKTIVVHSRSALLDTYEIIKKYCKTKVILHCYSGSKEMALEFLKLNVLLGIGGVLTFKNEKKLKEIVKDLPLESFVLETDSPYLSPEPKRGKKNEPINVRYVALKIAELKDISVNAVENITTKNATAWFDLKL